MSRPSSKEVRIVGRYRTRAAIASGCMGTVHLGQDVESGGVVAIKLLRRRFAAEAGFVETFLDEGGRAASVHHPNIVRTLDLGRDDERLFLVTEYVAAESLARLIYGKPRPAHRLAIAVIGDVLNGLQAAHEATDETGTPLNVVHGDVCPQNILVGVDGVSRVFDFAVAEPREVPSKAKLVYTAPERLEGERASPLTDLYSVGVLLWELVTGKRVFKGEDPAAIVACIREGGVPSRMAAILAIAAGKVAPGALAGLERLDAVVMRAVAPDPSERYASAREMAADLARALEPAPRVDVAAWVISTAREVLDSRAQLVASLPDPNAPEPDDGPASEPPTLMRTPANALLPILVAELADAAALRMVIETAAAPGTLIVPLLTPPGDAGDHILEVHVPGQDGPTRFLARAVGAPEPRGFPLSLRPYGEWDQPPAASHAPPTASVQARGVVRHSITESHSRDLTFGGGGSSPGLVEPSVLGRTLHVQGGWLVLEERLGGGGGGAVYRARYTDTKRRDVAVKVMHDRANRSVESGARFHAEALAASKLDHRNLVRVIDFGQEPDGLRHLTMEYLHGASLRQVLEAEGPLPMERAVELLGQVCAGLAHAHGRGVIHRDVKPSNVILVTQRDDDGAEIAVAKVCDFGIATGPVTGDEPTEAAVRVAGTPQYMSPEQCRGEAVDARSDVYACGVTLYELVTGRLPFEAREAHDFSRLHELSAPTPPSAYVPDMEPALEQLILKALAKTPGDRHQSMLELRAALKKLLEPTFVAEPFVAEPFVAEPSPSVVPPPRPSAGPSASPPDPEEGQPIERRLDALVGLLRSLSEVSDPPGARLRQIEEATERLERVLKALAAVGDAVALGRVIDVMAPLHEEAARAPSTELWARCAAGCASRLLHSIADPSALLASAQKLLSAGVEPMDRELSLLVWAKVAGAYALYMARTPLESRSARTRFVSAMRLLGESSLPVLRGALEQLWPAEAEGPSQPALVVDLLRSVPGARDDILGSTISRYARCPEPEIQEAALATLVHVWGDRAIAALLAGLQSPAEKVRLTALRGFKTIGGVDELAVRRIDAMLWSTPPISDELRVAIAEVLAYAAHDARPLAARATLRAVMDGVAGAQNAVVMAFARAALLLAPADARNAIEARAARGPDPLRRTLLALL